MKFEHGEVWGFDHAIRGMRNPLESWENSDSTYNYTYDEGGWCTRDIAIGHKDLKLMKNLIKGGSEHRKYLRQIMVSVDITAPIYWWKEFDTYKISTVSNSTSTMHMLSRTPITKDCFENSDMLFENTIFLLECCRKDFLESKDKTYWKKLIVNLPESWLQKRTVTLNYEVILNIIHQRTNHKLSEWRSFIEWAITLPYVKELFG